MQRKIVVSSESENDGEPAPIQYKQKQSPKNNHARDWIHHLRFSWRQFLIVGKKILSLTPPKKFKNLPTGFIIITLHSFLFNSIFVFSLLINSIT